MSEAREKLTAAINAAGLCIRSKFVPFSQSRRKDDKYPSLNWHVTLLRGTKEVITTDYMSGSAHCPAYKNPSLFPGDKKAVDKYTTDKRIAEECETGRATWNNFSRGCGRKIEPDPVNVIWCLIGDCDVLDAGSFEDWAAECGYDTDSRSAEKTYRDCLEIALKLRAVLGDDTLRTLRDAGKDY